MIFQYQDENTIKFFLLVVDKSIHTSKKLQAYFKSERRACTHCIKVVLFGLTIADSPELFQFPTQIFVVSSKIMQIRAAIHFNLFPLIINHILLLTKTLPKIEASIYGDGYFLQSLRPETNSGNTNCYRKS